MGLGRHLRAGIELYPGSTPAQHTLPRTTVGIKGCPGLSRWSSGTPPPWVNVCSGWNLRVSGQHRFEARKRGGGGGNSELEGGTRPLENPMMPTLVLQVPGAAAGVTTLAAGHATAREGQEDPAGTGRKQQPRLRRQLLPPGEPSRWYVTPELLAAMWPLGPLPKATVPGRWDGAGSILSPPVPAELESLSEGSPQPRYHAVCEIFGTRVIWKNGVILGFAA